MYSGGESREFFDLRTSAKSFAAELNLHFNWFGGVPDSVFKKVIPNLINWKTMPRENSAVSTAFGLHMGGSKPVVLLQNSGLGLCLDALFGTFLLYEQGLLMVVSNRGSLSWEECQHKRWGQVTHDLLRSTNIEFVNFNLEGMAGLKRSIDEVISNNKLIALVVERGNLDE